MKRIFMKTLLLTGSEGLIGKKLKLLLLDAGYQIRSLDIALPKVHPEHGDITKYETLKNHLQDVSGVIHLAGVSRVVWGQNDPKNCLHTNVLSTQHLLDLCLNYPNKPWCLYASSREVYGEQSNLPVKEDAKPQPLNVYARSKVMAEQAVELYRQAGLKTGILRFSNVYGSTDDHADRVVPAFCRAAATGGNLYLEGKDNIFDFTHVDDVALGILSAVKLLSEGKSLPTMHFVSGQPTSLAELANIACRLSTKQSELINRAPRNFDVARFYGDPTLAREILDWHAKIKLEAGLEKLVGEFSMLNKKQEKTATST
jgi:UDP-glucose 4-epimerase